MSSTQQPQPQAVKGRGGPPQSQGVGRLIAVGVIAVLLIIFIVSNRVPWKISFWFLHFTWPAWVVLIVVLVVGFLIGSVLAALLRRRKKRDLRRRAKNA
jgi:uncharacterized integral membrane protein